MHLTVLLSACTHAIRWCRKGLLVSGEDRPLSHSCRIEENSILWVHFSFLLALSHGRQQRADGTAGRHVEAAAVRPACTDEGTPLFHVHFDLYPPLQPLVYRLAFFHILAWVSLEGKGYPFRLRLDLDKIFLYSRSERKRERCKSELGMAQW